MTERISITKMMTMSGKTNSVRVRTARLPIAPPRAKLPGSPMITWAGWRVERRKTQTRPGQRRGKDRHDGLSCFYCDNGVDDYAIAEDPVASPSSPSVKLAALAVPTITNVAKRRKRRR